MSFAIFLIRNLCQGNNILKFSDRGHITDKQTQSAVNVAEFFGQRLLAEGCLLKERVLSQTCRCN